MSEIVQTKELKGLGGWLILFQIQIWSNLAGAAQILILFPIMGAVFNRLSSGYYELTDGFNMNAIYYSPYTYIFAAVIFVMFLLCVIFFYKKKFIFRVYFIIGTVIYIIGMAFYYIFILRSMTDMFADIAGASMTFTNVFTVFFIAFGLVPMIGIAIAFIIALFKSKRVKNTFS